MKIGKKSKQQIHKDPLKPKFPVIKLDNTKEVLYAFTDGGILGNGREVNEGGYGFVVVENDQVLYEYKRAVDNTTNNIMEMTAILDCLRWVEENAPDMQVLIQTDSQYCLHSICTWYKGYIARGWKNVKNAELWQQILELKDKLPNVQYKWIRAHQDDPAKVKAGNSEFETRWNTYADKLATEAYRGACTDKREEDKPWISWNELTESQQKYAKQRIDKMKEKEIINITEEEMQDMAKRGGPWTPVGKTGTDMSKKVRDSIYGISPKETKQRMEEAEELLRKIHVLWESDPGEPEYTVHEVQNEIEKYLKEKGLI